MTHVMRHGLYEWDSFEQMTWFVSYDWLNGMSRSDSYESSDGFSAMTHYES